MTPMRPEVSRNAISFSLENMRRGGVPSPVSSEGRQAVLTHQLTHRGTERDLGQQVVFSLRGHGLVPHAEDTKRYSNVLVCCKTFHCESAHCKPRAR